VFLMNAGPLLYGFIYHCHIFHVSDNVYTSLSYVYQPHGALKRLGGIWRFESECM
jgi:hypothetical protein